MVDGNELLSLPNAGFDGRPLYFDQLRLWAMARRGNNAVSEAIAEGVATHLPETSADLGAETINIIGGSVTMGENDRMVIYTGVMPANYTLLPIASAPGRQIWIITVNGAPLTVIASTAPSPADQINLAANYVVTGSLVPAIIGNDRINDWYVFSTS